MTIRPEAVETEIDKTNIAKANITRAGTKKSNAIARAKSTNQGKTCKAKILDIIAGPDKTIEAGLAEAAVLVLF